MLGLTLVAALSEGSLVKGIIGCCIGLMISMVGSAIVGGDIRFTAGSQALLGGVNIVVAMIGLFCIPVLIELVATPDAHLKVDQKLRGFRIRSEEHTSELQSLMRISYAVFCLNK